MSFKSRVFAKYRICALTTVEIPKGSLLFHGSLEEFSGSLRPGGDGIVWFADSPKIAQLYIPQSGMTMHIDGDSINRPDSDPHVQEIQRMIGIDYDYSKVEWEDKGKQRLKSFPLPKGWEHVPSKDEVTRLLEKIGFEHDHGHFKIHFGKNKILKPKDKQQGRLFVAKTKEPLKVWKKAKGEGDLMDLQYHDLSGFKNAQQAGVDGVLIDDFAQSENYGNFGHQSLGLYDVKKLEVKSIPAQYHEWDYKTKGTPEYPNPPPMFFSEL